MSRFRQLYVIDSLGDGGAQRQLVTLARGMVARGHDVEFFIYYPEYGHFRSAIEEMSLRVHEVWKKSRLSLKVPLALSRVIARGKYDIVLSFMDTPNLYAELSSIVNPATVFVASQRLAFPPGRIPVNLRLAQQFHRLADHVTVNSAYQADQLRRFFPWLSRRISTIYNGVDLSVFRPRRLERDGDRVLSLAAIGTVSTRKNVLGLIRALEIYRSWYGDCPKVTWIGAAKTIADHEVLQECLALVRQKELVDRVLFPGRQEDIPSALNAHDALIHPSFYEGVPNAICEALACGLPVLAGNVCDHGRLITEGVNGFLFDPSAPESMARALRAYAVLPPKDRDRMRHASRQAAKKNFALETYVDRYERLFLKLIEMKAICRSSRRSIPMRIGRLNHSRVNRV